MNYNGNEQLLGFDRVLLRGDEVPALFRDAGGRYTLQFSAPRAAEVSFVLQDAEQKGVRGADGVWRADCPYRTVRIGI